jgi:hypothetical protein
MTLILRTMKKHMGWDEQDDYVILDDDRRSVGRIYKRPHLAKVDLVREHLALPPAASKQRLGSNA